MKQWPYFSDQVLASPDTGKHEMDERFMFRLVRLALLLGFTGIGIRQRGDNGRRYVHIDDLDQAPGIPRPLIWSY